MKVLASDTFKKIKPLLVGDNYANLHARIALKLPPSAAAVFSKFTLQPAKGGAEWSTDLECADALRPLSVATPEQRAAVSQVLRDAEMQLKRVFPAQAAKLMQVPTEDSILFAVMPGGAVQPVLTRWGFRRVASGDNINVMRLILGDDDDRKPQDVLIRILHQNGTPVAGRKFTMHILNKELPFTTGQDGTWSPGTAMTGSQFYLTDEDGYRSPDYTVTSGQQDYEVTIPDPPAPPEPEPEEETVPEAELLPVPFVPEEEVVPPPPDIPDVPEIPEEPARPIVPLRLRLVDKKGRVLAGYPVKVMCQNGYEELTSDADGYITLRPETLIDGEKPKIELRRPRPGRRRKNQKLS